MRYELSDKEWSIIRAMLPTKPRGIPRVDDRRVLNGIFWVLRSGAPGATFLQSMALPPLATIVSFAGEGPASGTGSCRR
jgi:transposase